MAIDWAFAIGISLAGVVMGALTTFVGIRKGREVYWWLGMYVLWLAAVAWLRPAGPFLTVLVGSVLSGVWTPAVQVPFVETFRKNNPWYEDEFEALEGSVAARLFKVGVVLGALFGVIVGALAWGMDRFVL